MKIRYINTAIILYIAAASSVHSSPEDNTQLYYRAYNTCSPYAQRQTLQQCHYSKMVESFYVNCMHQSGYDGEDAITTQNYYKGYLKAHAVCSATANQSAQKTCGYGHIYQSYYNACMLELGFNSNGDSTYTPTKSYDTTSPSPDKIETKENPGKFRSKALQFFNELL